MIRRTIPLELAIAVLAMAPALGAAQQASCLRPADASRNRLVDQLRKIYAVQEEPYQRLRDSLRVPFDLDWRIEVETREAVCKKASLAYDREIVRHDGTPSQPRRLYLVRIGPNYFAAQDPDYVAPNSEWGTVVMLTADYQ